jgi:hypothetical protein
VAEREVQYVSVIPFEFFGSPAGRHG